VHDTHALADEQNGLVVRGQSPSPTHSTQAPAALQIGSVESTQSAFIPQATHFPDAQNGRPLKVWHSSGLEQGPHLPVFVSQTGASAPHIPQVRGASLPSLALPSP
jgi:hypothetical protein